jgi:hypothetical protein
LSEAKKAPASNPNLAFLPVAGTEGNQNVADLATLTAILYAARLSRRVPETVVEKRGTIAAAVADARLIVAATVDEEPDIRLTLARLLEAEPEQPPGLIKATRRRG